MSNRPLRCAVQSFFLSEMVVLKIVKDGLNYVESLKQRKKSLNSIATSPAVNDSKIVFWKIQIEWTHPTVSLNMFKRGWFGYWISSISPRSWAIEVRSTTLHDELLKWILTQKLHKTIGRLIRTQGVIQPKIGGKTSKYLVENRQIFMPSRNSCA